MGIGERNASFRQSVQIRSFYSRVILEKTHHVVEIVHRDKEDVGP